jgi:hypothetical protein
MLKQLSATLIAVFMFVGFPFDATAAETVTHLFKGVTYIVRTETKPRKLVMHIIKIDLRAPGLRFEVTEPSGSLETIRQKTLDFLNQGHAQVAINAHFFLPFPSPNPEADLVGFAASKGRVYSSFEEAKQSYAIVANAPALNIDPRNHASIVHFNDRSRDGRHVREHVKIWNAVSGSAQIVTDGVNTVPAYADPEHPKGQLQPGGPGAYSNAHCWYDRLIARNVIGLSRDKNTLILFAADGAGFSEGMTASEAADLLIGDYGVYNALHLDGGGSMTMAIENPITHKGELATVPSDTALGRAVGSNLAIFARPEIASSR